MGTAPEVDDAEVFLDTSVLVDFVQLGPDADCYELFHSRTDCNKSTSPKVRAEFRSKRDNRAYIVRKFQEQIGRDSQDFSDLELPYRDDFSDSDQEYAEELLDDLVEGDVDEPNKELSLRRKRFKKGYEVLLGNVEDDDDEGGDEEDDGDEGIVEVVPVELDAKLIGNLRSRVSNDDDCTVLAGAVDWAISRNRESVISEDEGDFSGNESEINDAIELTPSIDCTLCIYTSSEFLALSN